MGVDVFSSDDNEGLGWLRGTNYNALLICGDDYDLECNYHYVHTSEFQPKMFDDYQLVITVPSFYSKRELMYSTLSRIVDYLKMRAKFGWNRVACLAVRESVELMNSRWISGSIKGKLEAEQDFITLNNQAHHNGTGLAIDSLRPMSIVNDVRQLADYTIIKRLGRIQVPPELHYVFRYVQWKWARKMPLKDFIVYTDADEIYYGDNDTIDWHVVRGENMLSNLKIKVLPNGKSASVEPDKTKTDEYTENHKKIIELHEKGENQSDIASKLGLNRGTVIRHLKDHTSGQCKCGV